MGKKIRQQMNKARAKGITAAELLLMREMARKEAERMEGYAMDKAFLYMLAIPLNVLVNDYWPKSAKKKAPKFIEDVISLYEAVQQGVVSDEELADLLKDIAGVEITADWLKGKEKEE